MPGETRARPSMKPTEAVASSSRLWESTNHGLLTSMGSPSTPGIEKRGRVEEEMCVCVRGGGG